MRSEAGAGCGDGDAATGFLRKQGGRPPNVAGLQRSIPFDHGRGKRIDDLAQTRQTILFHEAGAEVGVVPSFVEDHPDHGGRNSEIVPRQRLEVNVGMAGGFAEARIDDDELRPARPRFLEALHRVRAENSDSTMRHQRVSSEQQRHVARFELDRTSGPAPHPLERNELGGLVHGYRRISLGRPDGRHEGALHRVGEIGGDRPVAAEHAHRFRPVFAKQWLQPLRDFGQRGLRIDPRETPVGLSLQRVQNAAWRMMGLSEMQPLEAGITATEPMLPIGLERNDTVIVSDGDLHPAAGTAQPAKGKLFAQDAPLLAAFSLRALYQNSGSARYRGVQLQSTGHASEATSVRTRTAAPRQGGAAGRRAA